MLFYISNISLWSIHGYRFKLHVVTCTNSETASGLSNSVFQPLATADFLRSTPKGRIPGYDARTGAKLWTFWIVPIDADDPAMTTWLTGTETVGSGNAWAPLSGDEDLGEIRGSGWLIVTRVLLYTSCIFSRNE